MPVQSTSRVACSTKPVLTHKVRGGVQVLPRERANSRSVLADAVKQIWGSHVRAQRATNLAWYITHARNVVAA